MIETALVPASAPDCPSPSLLQKLHAMVATLDLDEILTILLDILAEQQMTRTLILLQDERQHLLQLRAARGFQCDPAQIRRWLQSAAVATALNTDHSSMPTPRGAPFFPLAPEITAPLTRQESGITMLGVVPLRAGRLSIGTLICAAVPGDESTPRLARLGFISQFASAAIHNAQQFSQTRLQTITDPLTGLYNKRYFKQALPYEVARAQRYAKPMALMMLDLDHFKQLNDLHGHPKGDQVLTALGATLHEALRGTDFSFRYGGEEFAVILPETKLEHAFQVAEHLRTTLQERLTRQLQPGTSETVTASIGLAAYPHDGSSVDILLRHADHCLYKAKQQGRNRVYWEINARELQS